jgi:predicted DNA-binding transcriptional regulator AlpA
MDQSQPLDTPAQVAERLQMPEKTLAHWRYTGRGPRYIRLGKHVRYERSSVDEWLRQNLSVRPERTASAAELADESARVRRARYPVTSGRTA